MMICSCLVKDDKKLARSCGVEGKGTRQRKGLKDLVTSQFKKWDMINQILG